MDMSVKLNPPSYPGIAASGAGLHDKQVEKAAAEPNDTPVKQPSADATDLKSAVSQIQDFVQSLQRNLEFSVDDSTGQVVVKVVARDSGEVIRQIPTETALELAKSLHDVNSLLFDENV